MNDIKTFNDWVKEIMGSGNLCEGYSERLERAASNKQIMDIVLTSNGCSYLMETDSKGITLPYDVICSRFKYYINGRYKAEFANDKGNGYSTEMYCCFNGNVLAETTLLCLLGCDVTLTIKENDFVKVYCDKNTKLILDVPESSRIIIEYWGSFDFDYKDGVINNNVEFVKH